jgi:DNA polymerase-3 subunit epsilon
MPADAADGSALGFGMAGGSFMRERRRLAAVFVLCAVAAAAIVGGGLWRLGAADGAPPDAAAVVVLTVLGLCAALGFVWARVDRALLSPLERLMHALDTMAQAGPGAAVDVVEPGALAALVARVDALTKRVQDSQRQIDSAVAAATDRLEEERSRLAAILRDISEGVIVCNVEHCVLLFNNAARAAPDATDLLGLGRGIGALFDPAPLTAAFEKLRGGAAAPAPVALRPVAGGGALEARMAPIVEPDGDMRGYVLSFAAPGPPPPVPVSDGLPSRPVSVAAGGISLPCHSAQASWRTWNSPICSRLAARAISARSGCSSLSGLIRVSNRFIGTTGPFA